MPDRHADTHYLDPALTSVHCPEMTTMTDGSIALRELGKSADADFLREMIGFASVRLMELEVQSLTGTGSAGCRRSGTCRGSPRSRAGASRARCRTCPPTSTPRPPPPQTLEPAPHLRPGFDLVRDTGVRDDLPHQQAVVCTRGPASTPSMWSSGPGAALIATVRPRQRRQVPEFSGHQGSHTPQSMAASALSSAISCLSDNFWNSS
jgi:hypothetical protein